MDQGQTGCDLSWGQTGRRNPTPFPLVFQRKATMMTQDCKVVDHYPSQYSSEVSLAAERRLVYKKLT